MDVNPGFLAGFLPTWTSSFLQILGPNYCRDYQGPVIETKVANAMQYRQHGHAASNHHDYDIHDEEWLDWGLYWLLRDMDNEIYSPFQHRDNENNLKTWLDEMRRCAERGCPCWGFQLAADGNCDCGHDDFELRSFLAGEFNMF